MREVLRKRYYCDHCKKGGGSKGHMAKHERGCTLNPQRQCGVCDKIELNAAPLPELIAFVQSSAISEPSICGGEPSKSIDAAATKKLRELAGTCPACMLAALRQAGTFASSADFDFKKEIREVWTDYDGERY